MSFRPKARMGERDYVGRLADDTLGASGAAVKPWKSIVTGGSPYKPCLWAVSTKKLRVCSKICGPK